MKRDIEALSEESLVQDNRLFLSSYGTDGTREYHLWHCVTHAEPELTARPWFRVLNSHQGQSAYSGLVAELVI